MGKIKMQKFSAEEKNKFINKLVQILGSQGSEKELEKFVRYFFTPSEVVMLARRLQIADGLKVGKSYRELRNELGVGLGTVQNIDRWLRVSEKKYIYAECSKRQPKQRKATRGKPFRIPTGIKNPLHPHWG